MSQTITLTQAVTMTTLYRNERENILNSSFQGQDILCLSETFDRSDIESLLNVSDTTAIRIYYGMDEDKKVHAILVAVDDENKDILPSAGAGLLVEPPIIEYGKRCPPECPPSSALNP